MVLQWLWLLLLYRIILTVLLLLLLFNCIRIILTGLMRFLLTGLMRYLLCAWVCAPNHWILMIDRFKQEPSFTFTLAVYRLLNRSLVLPA